MKKSGRFASVSNRASFVRWALLEGWGNLPLFALGECAVGAKGVFFGLEEGDDLIQAGFELGQCLLERVRVFDGTKNRALGSVCFRRIGIGYHFGIMQLDTHRK